MVWKGDKVDEIEISVIIPVYNAVKYIEQCLTSVVSEVQKVKKLEIVLVDDGSNDGSEHICDQYAHMYKFIKVIHESNKGVSYARNEGINNATGKFIIFADADDYFVNDGLSRLLVFARNNKTELTLGNIRKVDFDRSDIKSRFYEKNIQSGNISRILCEYLRDPRGKNLISFVWNKLFLHEIIKNNNIKFDTDKVVNEDAEFVFKYISCIGSIGYLDDETYVYRTDRDNIGTHRMIDNPLAYRDSLRIIKNILIKNSDMHREEIEELYNRAFAILGMRNLFHIVRCNKEKKELREKVGLIIHDSEFKKSLCYLRKSDTENLWIIRYLAMWGLTDMVIVAFKAQLLKRSRKWTRKVLMKYI